MALNEFKLNSITFPIVYSYNRDDLVVQHKTMQNNTSDVFLSRVGRRGGLVRRQTCEHGMILNKGSYFGSVVACTLSKNRLTPLVPLVCSQTTWLLSK